MARYLAPIGLLAAGVAALGAAAWLALGPDDEPNRRGAGVAVTESPVAPQPVYTPRASVPSPEPMPEGWPPPRLQLQAIALSLKSPAADPLKGHRLGAFEVSPCYPDARRFVPCVNVFFYDYTVPTGMVASVDFGTGAVHGPVPRNELQPGFSADEAALVANLLAADPAFGPGLTIDRRHYHIVSNTDMGGQCGMTSPLHRCLLLNITKPDGSTGWVVVDMVDQQVVAVYSD